MSVYTNSYTSDIANNPETSLGKIAQLIGSHSKKIVDFGCAAGYFGQFLKEKTKATVWGVEIDPEDAKKAEKKLDKVLTFNLEEENWYKKFGNEKFDVAIFADVLEHLHNPKNALENTKKILNKDGKIIISVPNVSHQSILLELIFDQWNYEKSGLLDNTHVKFFTKQTIVSLIQKSGLHIKSIDSTITQYPRNYIEKIFKEHHKTLTPDIYELINQPEKKNFQYIIEASLTKTKTNIKLSSTIAPQTQWVEYYQGLVGNQTKIEQLNNEISKKNQELMFKEQWLNKIICSKNYKVWQRYCHIREWSRLIMARIYNKFKSFIPIKIRQKIKNKIKSFLPKRNYFKIPNNFKEEFNQYSDNRSDNSYDLINFSVISWNYRFQRPQHLAKITAQNGNRVFYIKNEFIPSNNHKNGFAPFKIEKVTDLVYEITLTTSENLFIYNDEPRKKDIDLMIASLKFLIHEAKIINPIAKVDHPFWSHVANQIKMPIIYDCMDNHQGFSENNKNTAILEKKLFKLSSQTIVTSKFLENLANKYTSKITKIPNAGDYEHFSNIKNTDTPYELEDINSPIIGYYGAIADWFDAKILEKIAIDFPKYSIVLIGSVNNSKVTKLANKYKNIYLLGEKTYQELPRYLNKFDVCIIPFILNELILATHPVKIFEYFAAGKPVISVKMPEILEYKDIMYFSDQKNFSKNIVKALHEKSDIKKERIKIAKNNTWNDRVKQLDNVIQTILYPQVDIVMLTYNNPELSKKSIDSVLNRSFYPNYKLIVVDNASKTETTSILKKYKNNPKVELIFNKQNLGFAGGNNVGLKQSNGDYIILLNNDILVTPGWISRLIFHSNHKNTGLVGPVTNNIGNEAKIDIDYNPDNTSDLEQKALDYTSNHWGETIELKNIAAFCWIMSKLTYKKIGNLDERFGRGMFEDDDYCIRVKKTGLKIFCADDVFIHHYGGASFKKIETEEYKKIFNENKDKFEKKWNTKWIPHVYRNQK